MTDSPQTQNGKSTQQGPAFVRNGPDRLQKVFLYLILVNWLVAGLLLMKIDSLSFLAGTLAGAGIILLQFFLLKLSLMRARRAGDGYLLYPVTASTLLIVLLLIGFFFFY
ncbi:hypothetical protein SAMN04488540_12156 [Ferrimonas sediminum]|uniref:Uncharacterized protein n=1 Tax=Ferrimonas sediminum TaxID=718193 RepID=A0A1G8ZZN8_9GAMM|nr:hypothetical protein [Ferrimonas sediminum]SDK20553.1 hypothetical protein SAMN04488540_12156 [Ferrimonas sediminum]